MARSSVTWRASSPAPSTSLLRPSFSTSPRHTWRKPDSKNFFCESADSSQPPCWISNSCTHRLGPSFGVISAGSWRITRRPKFSSVGSTSDKVTGVCSAYSLRLVACGSVPSTVLTPRRGSTGADGDSRAR